MHIFVLFSRGEIARKMRFLQIAAAFQKKMLTLCPNYELMTPAFQWICDGVQLQGVDTRRLEQWIEQVVAAHNRFLGPVSYIFCNDDRILEVNRQFLTHDYFTDIITFDYSHGRVVSGDMFISLDTVRTNAEQVGASYDRELLRVIVHGILHLGGINDKGPGEREIMERHEDEALAMLPADIAPVR